MLYSAIFIVKIKDVWFTHLVKKILSVKNTTFLPVVCFFQKLDILMIITHEWKSAILKEVD